LFHLSGYQEALHVCIAVLAMCCSPQLENWGIRRGWWSWLNVHVYVCITFISNTKLYYLHHFVYGVLSSSGSNDETDVWWKVILCWLGGWTQDHQAMWSCRENGNFVC